MPVPGYDCGAQSSWGVCAPSLPWPLYCFSTNRLAHSHSYRTPPLPAALTDTPNHLKALHRRAQATEALARQLIAARQRGQAPSSGAGGDGDGDGDGDGEDDAGAGPPPGPPSSLSTSASSLLTSTEEDLTQLLAHPSLPPSLRPTIQQSHARVKRDLEAERERDKEEVLGKLKDMGDKVLGWFGMSLDQFKVDKGPGGGMNLRFGG